MPSIEGQYEAAYLSFLLLLSRAHFYERIHQPDYRWSLRIAFTVFFSRPLYSRLRSFHIPSSYLFFLRSKLGFSQMQKIVRRETFDPGQSQRVCDGSKYFHTRCTFRYFRQTSVTRILLNDVEPFFSMAIIIK